jgi:hypothetical protein
MIAYSLYGLVFTSYAKEYDKVADNHQTMVILGKDEILLLLSNYRMNVHFRQIVRVLIKREC